MMLVETLAITAKIDKSKLIRFSNTASRRYKVYGIPKRAGGTRIIEHPSREIKAIQKWIVRTLFFKFPVHESSTAYRKGCGIRNNAERHKHCRFTSRYDFENFFPSFSQSQVEIFLRAEAEKVGIELSEEDVRFVGNVVCRNGRLTIGAPSSPAITNAMMFEFDSRFSEFCEERDLVFTRYADDIFVSSSRPNMLHGIEQEIDRITKSVSHLSIRLNESKTVSLSRKYNRTITGVVITPDGHVSIGRKRKREIKSLIHEWINGKIELERISYLRGLVAFARDIEPDFEVRLMAKYGSMYIEELLHGAVLPE